MHSDQINRRWLVFYTSPRSEKKCEVRLRERGIDVFLPKYTTVRQWKDRKKKVYEPLFRNYIFARVDEGERIEVLQTPGIVQGLIFGSELAQLSEDEIERLKISQKNPDSVSVSNRWLPAVGEVVTVKNGALKGLKGEVLEQRGEIYIIVRVNAIKQMMKVHVSIENIQSLEIVA